jgi:hypothetical protein
MIYESSSMARSQYDDTLTLREARQLYFDRSGFDDKSYKEDVVYINLGPIKFPILNTVARKKTVPLHDLHHVVTGYDTSWLGESEISAWEIGAGGTPKYLYIKIIIWSAVFWGLFINPRAVWRAYKRGHGSRNLFNREYTDDFLNLTVGHLKKEIGIRV